MIEITDEPGHVTVINVFVVRGTDQGVVVERLQAVNERIAREPGYLAASVHRSTDGTRVANYAQWRSQQDILSALTRPEMTPLLDRLTEVAHGDWHLYDVIATDPPHRERWS